MKSLKHLLEWETMLALPCSMPILFVVDNLIEFAQSPCCYVVGFINIVKIHEANIYHSCVVLAYSYKR